MTALCHLLDYLWSNLTGRTEFLPCLCLLAVGLWILNERKVSFAQNANSERYVCSLFVSFKLVNLDYQRF